MRTSKRPRCSTRCATQRGTTGSYTTDAQAVAQAMLGDTLPSNIVMLGVAFQRGLIPVSEAALLRAIELNGVAVETNKAAFALGRLAVAAPEALQRLAGADAPAAAPADTLDALDRAAFALPRGLSGRGVRAPLPRPGGSRAQPRSRPSAGSFS